MLKTYLVLLQKFSAVALTGRAIGLADFIIAVRIHRVILKQLFS
jgi:hypothetical protein